MEQIITVNGKHIVLRWCMKCQMRELAEEILVCNLKAYNCLQCEERKAALRRSHATDTA